MRNSILAILGAALAFTSCSTSYNIKGSSDLTLLDGHTLYLKALKGDELKNIDSCDVVHGEFNFHGSVDSVRIGAIFMNEENLLPVVLEEGELVIKINNTRQSCSGSPLNDKLSDFSDKLSQIDSQLADLSRQPYQAIMNGEDVQQKAMELQPKVDKLSKDKEDLILKFIEDNFDNILGPYAFRVITDDGQPPMLAPWIEALMSKATDAFKNDAYVKEYMEIAQRNQNIMNGMEQAPMAPQAAPAPEQPLPDAPTPNELAKPAEE